MIEIDYTLPRIGAVLSSEISDITILTDAQRLEVTVTAGTVELYSEKLYSYAGKVIFSGLRDLVETHLRDAGESFAKVILKAAAGEETDTVQIPMLFSSRMPIGCDVAEFLEQNFLTCAPSRRVAGDAVFSLQYWGSLQPVEIRGEYITPEGKRGSVQLQAASDSGSQLAVPQIHSIDIDVAALIKRLRQLGLGKYAGCDLTGFSIGTGSRSAMYFIDPAMTSDYESDRGETTIALRFRNCFNVPDYVWMPARIIRQTERSASEATIGDRISLYDCKETQSFSVTGGALSAGELALCEQLTESREVKLISGEEQSEVLITEAECKYDRDAEEPPVVKFTMRYASTTGRIRLPGSPGIFTEQYTSPFS